MKATLSIFALLIMLALCCVILIYGYGWPTRVEKSKIPAVRPVAIAYTIFPHRQANRFLDAPTR